MNNEKKLSSVAALMFVLNLVIIVFYSVICAVTTLRICDSFGAYEFLAAVRQTPRYPWRMPVWALSQYFLLWAVSFGKSRWEVDRLEPRLLICLVEIVLCVGVTASLDFYYSGVALLVLADLVRYVRNSIYRLCFMVALIFLFAFGQYEIVSAGGIPFSAYMSYYNPNIQGFFTGTESILVSMNVLLFVFYMILLFTGQKAENVRIRRLNEQLHDANEQLRGYTLKLERMTEIRERNRLAREIHDTLGCQRQSKIVRKRRRNFVVFRRGGNKIK